MEISLILDKIKQLEKTLDGKGTEPLTRQDIDLYKSKLQGWKEKIQN